MSVTPLAALPVPPVEAPELEAAPTLQLVAPHEHTWQLRAVEYDEALEVRRYECDVCEDVLYR